MNKVSSKHKKLPAFSLMEMIVTMGILAIIIVMLSNVLINSILISQRTLARSFIREEVADVMDRITLDIRKANTVTVCEGDGEGALCELVLDVPVSWSLCDLDGTGEALQICKMDEDGSVLYASSPNLKIDQFTIDQGYEAQGSNRQRNILVTLVGSHANPNYAVKNMVSQIAVSTRNYFLIK